MKFETDIYDLINAPGFYYLATPYTLYPGGLEQGWKAALRVAGRLSMKGVSIYCPIAESHPIAMECGIDPLDVGFWYEWNKPKLEASHGIIVARLLSWQASAGVAHEIEVTRKAGKPIIFLTDGPDV